MTRLIVSIEHHDASALAKLAARAGLDDLAATLLAELRKPPADRMVLPQLDHYRRLLGLSWRDLGAACGRDGATVWRYATGESKAPRRVVYALVGLFRERGMDVRPEDLFPAADCERNLTQGETT